jgi:hypothetical protein
VIQVSIQSDYRFVFDGIGIAIRDKNEDGARYAVRFGEYGHLEWEYRTRDEALTVQSPPMVLTDDIARALLQELIRYYHGAEDTRSLRRDYDHERGRVDKLTEALIAIAAKSSADDT